MSVLRLRVELNKGRIGMPMGKLASVVQQTVKFLDAFTRDMKISDTDGLWLAERFENNSVDFDCRLALPLSDSVMERTRSGLKMVLSGRYDDPKTAILITPETRWQYARIAKPIDPDEVIYFGLYRGESNELEELFTLDQSTQQELEDAASGRHRIYGEIQGIVHSFVKEGKRPHLSIRELSTGELVKCYFKPEQYQAAVEVLADPEAVVFVEGDTTQDPLTGEVTAIEVSDFRLAPLFSMSDLEAWTGSMPDLTGLRTTEQHLSWLRDE